MKDVGSEQRPRVKCLSYKRLAVNPPGQDCRLQYTRPCQELYTRYFPGNEISINIAEHPNNDKCLEVVLFYDVATGWIFNQLPLAVLGYILAIRFARGGGKNLHLIIIAVQGIDNGIQSVISPCRESGSITSAPRLYRTFHDLLMSTT